MFKNSKNQILNKFVINQKNKDENSWKYIPYNVVYSAAVKTVQ